VLTLIVSTEGVLLALAILISQNRMIRQADAGHSGSPDQLACRAGDDAAVRTLQSVARHLGLPEDRSEAEAKTLARKTDLNAMVQRLIDTHISLTDASRFKQLKRSVGCVASNRRKYVLSE
jgi:hypothetical protein